RPPPDEAEDHRGDEQRLRNEMRPPEGMTAPGRAPGLRAPGTFAVAAAPTRLLPAAATAPEAPGTAAPAILPTGIAVRLVVRGTGHGRPHVNVSYINIR